jgi:hypothetical protein
VFPTAQTAVMHPHEGAMSEGVAVIFAKRAFGRGAYVAEDESGSSFGGDSLQVRAVPCWDG